MKHACVYFTETQQKAHQSRCYWARYVFGSPELSPVGRAVARRQYMRALHECELLGLL